MKPSRPLRAPLVVTGLCLGVFAGAAFAHPGHDEPGHALVDHSHADHDHHGHDHHGHDHARQGDQALAPHIEAEVARLWRESDQAFHAGDHLRAVAIHRQIVSLAPDEIESYAVASWLLWSAGRGEEAERFIDQGLRANPKSVAMWDAAGQHFDLQKKAERARDSYARAVELAGPAGPQLLRRRLAHSQERAGDLSASAQTWRALVRDFPNDAVNANNLRRVEEKRAAAPTARATTRVNARLAPAPVSRNNAPANTKPASAPADTSTQSEVEANVVTEAVAPIDTSAQVDAPVSVEADASTEADAVVEASAVIEASAGLEADALAEAEAVDEADVTSGLGLSLLGLVGLLSAFAMAPYWILRLR